MASLWVCPSSAEIRPRKFLENHRVEPPRLSAKAVTIACVLAASRAAMSGLPPSTSFRSNSAKPAPASSQPGAHSFRLPATLAPNRVIDIYAKASGYVRELRVDIGARVHKGDVLLIIDVPENADELRSAEAALAASRAKVDALTTKVAERAALLEIARAEVRRAEAEHKLRRITADRKRELRKENAIPEQELDDIVSQLDVAAAQVQIATAKVSSAQAEKASAEADVVAAQAGIAVAAASVARIKTLIDYQTISAPFDGVITARQVDIGAFVRSAAMGAGAALLTLAQQDRLRAVVEVPEYEIPRVHEGMPVEIVVQALPGEPLKAAVSRTSATLHPATRTMRTEIDVDNRAGRLVPGMYAHVVFETAPLTSALRH